MNTVAVKPRIWPRDSADALIVLGVGVVAIVGGMAGYGSLELIERGLVVAGFSRGDAVLLVAAFCFALVLLLPSWLLCRTVRRLELGPDGVRFVRVIGRPRFLRWTEVEEIAAASRSEVLRHPLRDQTGSLVSGGQYRLRYRGGVRYFPPARAGEFEALVHRFWGAAQRADEADETRSAQQVTRGTV